MATKPKAPELWPQAVERQLLADACRDDFYLFCYHAFGYGLNPAGHWFTEHTHRPLCDWLQKHAEKWFARRARKEQGRMKLLVCVPRTHGKTTVISKAFQAWLHLHDVNLSSVTGSEDQSKASEFMRSILQVISGGDPYARFTWLYGNWKDKRRPWQATSAVHGMRTQLSLTEPSFGTTSVGVGKTGYHPDLYVLDDPVSYEKLRETGSHNQNCWTHIGAMIPVIKPNGAFIMVGTRYLDDDPIGRLMAIEGIYELEGMPLPPNTHVPIREDGQWAMYHLVAEQGIDDDGIPIPTLPEAWSGPELLAYKKARPIHYMAQMMNDPATGAMSPVSPELIERLWVNREDIPRNAVVTVHLDTAFRHGIRRANSDESVIQVWGHSGDGSGRVYFLEGVGSAHWTVDEFSDRLIAIVQRYRARGYHIRGVTDETDMGGKQGTYQSYLQSLFHKHGMIAPAIHLLRRHGQGMKKIDRILDAASYWVDGMVRLVKDAQGVDRLVEQMCRIGVSSHDDWADAAADVFRAEIYTATRFQGADGEQSYYPQRPYDDILQGGAVVLPGEDLTPDVMRHMYDAATFHHDGRLEHLEEPGTNPVVREPI